MKRLPSNADHTRSYMLVSDEIKDMISQEYDEEPDLGSSLTLSRAGATITAQLMKLQVDSTSVGVTLPYSNESVVFVDSVGTDWSVSVTLGKTVKTFDGKHTSTVIDDIAGVFPLLTLQFACQAK